MKSAEIFLYGHRNSITENIRFELEKKIVNSGSEISLTEIHDPAVFTLDGITRVPAVRVRSRLFIYDEKEERLSSFITKIISEAMKKTTDRLVREILVPLDFSDYSRNAFYQAFKMARRLKAGLTVVHVFSPVVVPAEGVLYIDPELQKDMKTRFEAFTADLLKSLTDDDRASVTVSHIFRTGMITVELQDIIRETPGSMLVLSTSGTGQKIKEIFGSVSLWVVKHAECPVLLIPPGTHDLSFDHIVLASDHFGVFDSVIAAIRYYTGNYHADIDVVHVFTEGSEFMPNAVEIKQNARDSFVKEVIIFNDDFPGSIQEYVKNNHKKLLVMERKDRGFWKELFHTSMTRKMAVNSEVPMLILHADQIKEFE